MRFNRHATHQPPQAPAEPEPVGPVTALGDDNFGTIAGAVTLVDFWAPWCAPCRMFAPIFEAAASDHGDRVRFAKCNVDTSPDTAARLGIMSIPTLVAFDADGHELGRLTGALPRRDLDLLVDEIVEAAHAHRGSVA